MKESTIYSQHVPQGVMGNVSISYTDPVTSKIKEQIKGTNHIYKDAIFCQGWMFMLDTIPLFLTDSTQVINDTFPYLLGKTVGYGLPETAASGLYRGNYNTALSHLHVSGQNSLSWKYVYDFAPSQVTEPVKSIGLTYQNEALYSGFNVPYEMLGLHTSGWILPVYPTQSAQTLMCLEGRYVYDLSATGIVTKTDVWTSSVTITDISASIDIGTGRSYYLGYAPQTGKFYVFIYSSTVANRKAYVFSNDSFTSLIATYDVTNFNITASGAPISIYVYDDIAHVFNNTSVRTVDFVNNTAPAEILLPPNSAYSNTARTAAYPTVHENYVLCAGSTRENGIIFSLKSSELIGYISSVLYTALYPRLFKHPKAEKTLYGQIDHGSGSVYPGTKTNNLKSNCAFACYKVPDDAPERPAGYGMTITYEIEVQY